MCLRGWVDEWVIKWVGVGGWMWQVGEIREAFSSVKSLMRYEKHSHL